MAVKFQYMPHPADDETPIRDIICEYNDPRLPSGIIEKVVGEFEDVNTGDFEASENVYVPILPPFVKKHKGLVTKKEIEDQRWTKKVEITETEPEVVEVVQVEERSVVAPPPPPPTEMSPVERSVKPIEKPPVQPTPIKTKAAPKQIEKPGKLNYKSFPYTFSRPGETIEAIIRLYNDMSVSRAMIDKLCFEFNKNNPEANPPKLGQTVQVPVLLPFTYRHLNDNKIFKDE